MSVLEEGRYRAFASMLDRQIASEKDATWNAYRAGWRDTAEHVGIPDADLPDEASLRVWFDAWWTNWTQA